MFPRPCRMRPPRCSTPSARGAARIATAESCTGGLIAALLDGDPRRLRRGRARLRHLLQRGQARDARRPAEPDRRARRRQRAGGARHGRGRARAFARRCRGLRHRALPVPAAAARPSRSASCIWPSPRKGGPTLHRECRFGDIGRDGSAHASPSRWRCRSCGRQLDAVAMNPDSTRRARRAARRRRRAPAPRRPACSGGRRGRTGCRPASAASAT